MSTIGDQLGRGARPDLGVGESQAPGQVPKEESIIYAQWRRGLNTAESPQDIEIDAAADLLDVEVDHGDALIRAPGTTFRYEIDPNPAAGTFYLFQQAGLDFSTELVAIVPPQFGYGNSDSMTFVAAGIAATSQFGWAAADVAGTLIFSNGLDATYTREAGAAIVTDISSDIIAQSFATAFGRVFAGAPNDPVAGIQSLAVQWNAANGALDDWSGIGSGVEFLIANNLEADRIVAMVPIGLNALGILCRKSLWAGYKTGIADRPADFQLRFAGLGCVSRESACSTPLGIMYLSDQGVCLYDLNNAQVISAEVHEKMLPLDYAQLSMYHSVFDETKQRYMMSTPSGIFIYELPEQRTDGTPGKPPRWFVRSFLARTLVMFTDQTGNVYWNTVPGTWAQQNLTWAEMAIGEEDAPAIPFFVHERNLGYENYNATSNFGESEFDTDPMDPFWVTKDVLEHVSDNIETHFFEVQYSSQADAEVTFTTTDTEGELVNSITKVLPNTNGARKIVVFFTHSMCGQGTSMKIAFGETAICAIDRVRRVVMQAGPAMTSTI